MGKFSKLLKFLLILFAILLFSFYFFQDRLNRLLFLVSIGTAIDSFNRVKVFYNGKISNINGRNITSDGYNLGLKYQCVEFVKRYYYEYYRHKMPDSYGHAFSFFNSLVPDSSINSERGLLQCRNPGKCKPQIGDLLIFDKTSGNPYGHVAIVSEVTSSQIEIIQQNPGISGPSRLEIKLFHNTDGYRIDNERILGWLRMK